ncbi:MAG: RHS repeat protein [Lachnospiraceae bacterium]|nr:RHS repeat protein [Lachnospiraceae bacterium]
MMKKVTQIFIVIELVCLLGLFLYTQKEEKPEVAEQIEETTTLEESQSDDIVAVLEESCKEEESETEEESTVSHEESEQEDFYAIVTEKSQIEVEEYARQVKELFLNHKWDKIAEMISYPIEIDGIEYAEFSDVVQLELDNKYSEMFMSALGQESCQAMYCDSDGICLGSGEIWIAEVEQNGSKELKIVSINRLMKREKETNLLVREKYQKADWTAARETKYIYDNQEQLWKTVRYDGEGKVQEVCEKFYDLDGNVVKWISYDEEGNKTAIRENHYDESGKLYKGILYDGEGKTTETYESNYNKEGNLLKEATYDSEGTVIQSYECSYDKNENLLEEISYDSEGTVSKTYDSQGRLLKTVTLDSAGNSVAMEENSYDKAGNLLEETSYGSEGKITEIVEHSYDEAGNLIKKVFYDGEGKKTGMDEYSYDDEGKLVEVKDYTENTGIYGISPEAMEMIGSYTTIYYDENGRIIKESSSYAIPAFQVTSGVKEYKYDKEGNLVEFTIEGFAKLKYEYTYNEQNQMVKYTYYYDGEIRESRECFYMIG